MGELGCFCNCYSWDVINCTIEHAGPSTSFDVQSAVTPPSVMDEDMATATSFPLMEVQTAPVMRMPQTIYIVPQFDIRQILTSSTEGKLILESLDEENLITIKQRRCLVRILVSYLMEKFGDSPSSETKKSLATALIETFPCLKDESSSGIGVWFTPGRSNHPATGFLEERLRNSRKRVRLQRRSQGTQQRLPQNNEDGVRRTCIPDSTISEEKAMQLKEWLRHNSQPLSKVEQYMLDTAVYRAKMIRGNKWDIQEVCQEFPHLLTQGMIAQDFEVLHREAAPKLYETWLPLYAEKILHLARREGKLTSSLDGLTPDCLGELALSQLPTLLPPTVYKVGRKVFRHTIEESKLAFIHHKPVGTNLVEYLNEAKASRPYPYVLSLGNNICHTSQAFVIVAGEALEQQSLLQAVDVCFKVFYVFDIEYPKQCAPVWEFLQNGVYGMEGDESKPVKFLRAAILACK
ncbi:uncharacterized protein LOC121639051 [Melanotaenia boesemani]|uniref:uncharacterized protein LOC121639051 n=1 Tax=Melanotaenia boesemani TaxID=1250792 RepID=UPI001C043917|nr:uncharacterized protein LOC121639051 [Melanotaenia boesemani]